MQRQAKAPKRRLNTDSGEAGDSTEPLQVSLVVSTANVDQNIPTSQYKYRQEIQQMMFVSGETNDPPEKTTDLIEDIVKDQVLTLVMSAQKIASSRGQRSILPEDLIFIIRHDRAKVNRLRTYLSWKDVRKNAKDQDGDQAGAGQAGNAPTGGPGGGGDLGGVDDDTQMASQQKKNNIHLPWELQFMFSEQPLLPPKEDEEQREAIYAQFKRLKQNDDRTKSMTQQEYVHWSECRQASFTFKKGKRFREWSGIGQVTDSKPNDDVVDILGFLTFEMVCSLTEEALRIKQRADDQWNGTDRQRRYLFTEPSNQSKPIQVEHIQEAWRLLQESTPKFKALYNFKGGRMKKRVRII